MRIFLAGAAGVIGRRLVPLLVADGHEVVGTTRSADNADWLRGMNVTPAVLDIFDADAVMAALAAARSEIVIHQLTDLPDVFDVARMTELLARNARIRDEGTRNLLAAARAAGVARVIAQSIAFSYAPGPQPYREDAPLNVDDGGNAGISARGVASLEQQVLGGPWCGIVLRYGRLYGPGAPDHAPPPAIHVDVAAEIARRAVAQGDAGLYNVSDDDGFADSSRAKRTFGAHALTAPPRGPMPAR